MTYNLWLFVRRATSKGNEIRSPNVDFSIAVRARNSGEILLIEIYGFMLWLGESEKREAKSAQRAASSESLEEGKN
jgi:hypothetical protein